MVFNKNKNQRQTIPKADKKIPLDPQEKIRKDRNWNIGILAVFSIAVLTFGVWYIGDRLNSPLEINSNKSANTNQQLITYNSNSLAKLEGLRDKDTDGDGLSDYDELYYYKTSPYLSDSDSDKISDGEEIGIGSNPNCPEGRECGRTTDDSGITTANTNTGLGNFLSDLEPEETAASDSLTADQLRNVLRDAGVSEISLQDLDDATLLEMYQGVVAEEEGTEAGNSAASDASSSASNELAVTYEQLKNLSVDEIRWILIENGIDQATLDTIDDETLRQIYLESLEQNYQDVQ